MNTGLNKGEQTGAAEIWLHRTWFIVDPSVENRQMRESERRDRSEIQEARTEGRVSQVGEATWVFGDESGCPRASPEPALSLSRGLDSVF